MSTRRDVRRLPDRFVSQHRVLRSSIGLPAQLALRRHQKFETRKTNFSWLPRHDLFRIAQCTPPHLPAVELAGERLGLR
jgi:hypothetical protein